MDAFSGCSVATRSYAKRRRRKEKRKRRERGKEERERAGKGRKAEDEEEVEEGEEEEEEEGEGEKEEEEEEEEEEVIHKYVLEHTTLTDHYLQRSSLMSWEHHQLAVHTGTHFTQPLCGWKEGFEECKDRGGERSREGGRERDEKVCEQEREGKRGME